MDLKSSFAKGLMVLLFMTFCGINLQGQAQEEEDHSYKPFTLKLNESGSKYIRFLMWHQVWLTTNNLSNEDTKLQITPSIRRSRFLAFAQVSPRFLILTHFGLNSLTPDNATSLGNNGNAPQFFLHGAWTEFRVNDGLYLGGGLHYWKGLTRLANQSTLNFLTLDQSRPFVHWHSLGVTDQFARHLGVYAKGQLGKFDYRVAINAPIRAPLGNGQDYGLFNSGLTYTGVINPDENGNPLGNTLFEGYFRYDFWEKESTKLPYQVGSYLGNKKVLGIGTGFFSHPNGMYRPETGQHESVFHFAVDAFMDLPTEVGGITAYASFINFDYGENYVSRWGGTGTSLYGHLGYHFKKAKLTPYLAYQNSDFEGLDDHITTLDIGLNYHVLGHHAKLTLEYHRIVNDIREEAIDPLAGTDALSSIRLQAHIFL